MTDVRRFASSRAGDWSDRRSTAMAAVSLERDIFEVEQGE